MTLDDDLDLGTFHQRRRGFVQYGFELGLDVILVEVKLYRAEP